MLQAAEVQLVWKFTGPLRNVDTGRKSVFYKLHIVSIAKIQVVTHEVNFFGSAQMEDSCVGQIFFYFQLPGCDLMRVCQLYFHVSLAESSTVNVFFLGRHECYLFSHSDQLKMKSASPQGTNSFINVTGSCQAHFLIPHPSPLLQSKLEQRFKC